MGNKIAILATDENGLVFSLEKGLAPTTSFSRDRDIEYMSTRLDYILERSSYASIALGDGQYFVVKRNLDILDILQEFKRATDSLIGENGSTREESRDTLDTISKIIASLISSSRTARKSVISTVIREIDENEIRELSHRDELKSERSRELLGYRPVSSIVFSSVKEESEFLIKSILNYEEQLTSQEIYGTNPYGNRLAFSYEDVASAVFLSHNLRNIAPWSFRAQIEPLVLWIAMRFTPEFTSDSRMDARMANDIWSNSFYGSLLRMTNRDISSLTDWIAKSDRFFGMNTNFETVLRLEMTRRGMRKELSKIKIDQQSRYDMIRVVSNTPQLLRKYTNALLSIKDDILINSSENEYARIQQEIRNFSNAIGIEEEKIVDRVFESKGSLDFLSSLRGMSDEYKMLMVKLSVSGMRNNGEGTFLPDDEVKRINYSPVDSGYKKVALMFKAMTSNSAMKEELVREVCQQAFRSMASAGSSERRILVRITSFFLHSKRVTVANSDESLSEESKRNVLIFMEELSKSALKNVTVESIIKQPSELYEKTASSKTWMVSRSTNDGFMLGISYIDIYGIISESENVRDAVKSSLLLLSLR